MSDKKISELTPRQFAFMLGKELNTKEVSATVQHNRLKKLEVELAKVTLERKKYKQQSREAMRDASRAVRELREIQLENENLKKHNDELIWAQEDRDEKTKP